MAEKLIFVEGPSGSGKTKHAFAVQRAISSAGGNIEIERGMLSQKDEENARLPLAVRRQARGIHLNFHECSRLPISQLEVIKGKVLLCGSLLFKEALDLRNETGHDTLMNRSGISHTAIFLLAEEVASQRGEEGDEQRASWARNAQAEAREILLNNWVLGKIDGIIHLQKRLADAPTWGRGGMEGLEDREAFYISQVIDEVTDQRQIPVLRIDVNDFTNGPQRGQDITQAVDFIRGL